MAQFLVPCWVQFYLPSWEKKKKSTETHVHIFESLQLEGLYVGNLLYLKFLPAGKNKPYLPLILEDPIGLENHWK